MRFLPTVPPAPLDAYADLFWQSETAPNEAVEGAQFPGGGVSVLFGLGPPQGLFDPSTGATQWFRGSWVAGERSRPLHLRGPGGTLLVGVHFRPGGAAPFFRQPLDELAECVLPLDCFWPDAAQIGEQMAAETTPAARLRVLASALLARCDARATPAVEIARSAVAELRRHGPGASVDALAARLGFSSRHLRRVFAEQVGIAPKALHRVLRFQRVIRALDAGQPPEWSELALRCGYFDQPHLVRDFRAFTDLRPSEYAALRSPDPNFALEPER